MKTFNLRKTIIESPSALLSTSAFCLMLLLGVIPTTALSSDWHVDEASIRFELSVTESPTYPGAGYFVQLPDGGILPGPCPVTRVVSGDGRALESALLWHNPESGMAMVFSDSGLLGETVFVYVVGAENYALWQPKSGIKPSAILASAPGTANMADAQKLASLGRVGRNVRYWNRIGGERAPFCIEGDHAGRKRPGAFYLLAHVVSDDPGKTWIAPFTQDGESQVRLNGARIVPERRIDKWGGTGQWVEIGDGLNRVEVFQTAPGSDDYSDKKGALMFLTWRTPHASMHELGGVRSEAVPMTGTSRMETRVLRKDEIASSGSAVIESARSKTGAPVALIEVSSAHVFWIGDEIPIILYRFGAVRTGNSDETRYEWGFADGARVSGDTVYWLLSGHRETRIQLSAATDSAKSQTVLYQYAFSHALTSMNNPDHRKAYRTAMLQMLQAYSETPDVIAKWDAAYWNNLLRTLDFGSGYEMLLLLFDKYSSAVTARLSSNQISTLQEMFIDAASAADPQAALKWLKKFRDESGDEDRKKHLLVREAEIQAYYLEDYAAAKRLLTPLARGTDSIGQLARIRFGDIAFMERDLNMATRSYANVQSLVRHDRKMSSDIYDGLDEGAAKAPVELKAGPMTTTERLKADREKFMEAARRQKEKFMEAAGSLGSAASRPAALWKLSSLLDASASENVRQLITDKYWLEARQSLEVWERELPLSKIAGDYVLQESRLYYDTGNPRRAYAMLRAYCDQIDASSFLPEAAKLLVACMKELQFPEEEISSCAKKLGERLEFHPVARDLEALLKGDGKPEAKESVLMSDQDIDSLKSLFGVDEE